MSDTTTSPSPRHRLKLGAAAIALLAIGGGVGAFAGHAIHPAIAMAPTHAVPIKSLTEDGGIVTVRGRVAERYGNQFVLEDGTGKTLIDAGPAGEQASLAPVSSIVSVQGRFDNGALRPSFLVDPSGKVIALGHGGQGVIVTTVLARAAWKQTKPMDRIARRRQRFPALLRLRPSQAPAIDSKAPSSHSSRQSCEWTARHAAVPNIASVRLATPHVASAAVSVPPHFSAQ